MAMGLDLWLCGHSSGFVALCVDVAVGKCEYLLSYSCHPGMTG